MSTHAKSPPGASIAFERVFFALKGRHGIAIKLCGLVLSGRMRSLFRVVADSGGAPEPLERLGLSEIPWRIVFGMGIIAPWTGEGPPRDDFDRRGRAMRWLPPSRRTMGPSSKNDPGTRVQRHPKNMRLQPAAINFAMLQPERADGRSLWPRSIGSERRSCGSANGSPNHTTWEVFLHTLLEGDPVEVVAEPLGMSLASRSKVKRMIHREVAELQGDDGV